MEINSRAYESHWKLMMAAMIENFNIKSNVRVASQLCAKKRRIY